MTNAEVFVSHDHADESLALLLKELIEETFLNVSVFISGRDLTGGDIWINEIRDRLKTSSVVVALITQYSVNNPWVLFESGAGFMNSKCIPVCADQVSVRKLSPPLNQLHARSFASDGLQKLIKGIAKTLGIRAPKEVPKLVEVVNKANNFVEVRERETREREASTRKVFRGEVIRPQYDKDFLKKVAEIETELKHKVIDKILKVSDRFAVPDKGTLDKMDLRELSEVCSAFNIMIPRTALLQIYQLQLDKLEANAPVWKKMNHEKKLAAAKKSIDQLSAFGI